MNKSKAGSFVRAEGYNSAAGLRSRGRQRFVRDFVRLAIPIQGLRDFADWLNKARASSESVASRTRLIQPKTSLDRALEQVFSKRLARISPRNELLHDLTRVLATMAGLDLRSPAEGSLEVRFKDGSVALGRYWETVPREGRLIRGEFIEEARHPPNQLNLRARYASADPADQLAETLVLVVGRYFGLRVASRIKKCPRCHRWFADHTKNRSMKRCSLKCTWRHWNRRNRRLGAQRLSASDKST